MNTAAAERREEMLGLLAEKALALACAVQQRALDAETADEMGAMASAFHKLGRCVRQTIALQARLEGQRLEAAAKAPASPTPAAPSSPPDPRKVAVRRRRDWLTRGVERCVWNEYERDDDAQEFTGDSLLEDLEERLADLTTDIDAFLALDPDELLIQLCKDLGLKPPEFHPPAPATAPPIGIDGAAAETAATNTS